MILDSFTVLRNTFSKLMKICNDRIFADEYVIFRKGLSEPDFYGDLVHKLKKITGSHIFSAQFIK